MNTLEKIERKMLTDKDYPIEIGDTVRVKVRVIEGSKEREQAFQGVVIQRRGGGAGDNERDDRDITELQQPQERPRHRARRLKRHHHDGHCVVRSRQVTMREEVGGTRECH